MSEKDYSYNPEDETEEESNTDSTTPKSEWEKYLDTLDQERLKQLTELAKLSTYKIDGKDYTRKKLKVKQ